MSFSAAETRVENCAGRTVFIQTRHTFPCTGVLPVLFPQNKSFIRFGMDAGNAVRSRVVNCTQDVQFRYRQRASPYAIHTFRPVCVLWLEKVVLLCFGYSLRERTNERTNERNYGARGGFVKYLRLSRLNLCYFVLRKRGMVVERNTVCATVLFHRYYYNLLSGRFQPLGEVFNMKRSLNK